MTDDKRVHSVLKRHVIHIYYVSILVRRRHSGIEMTYISADVAWITIGPVMVILFATYKHGPHHIHYKHHIVSLQNSSSPASQPQQLLVTNDQQK